MRNLDEIAARLTQDILRAKPLESRITRTHIRASEVSNCIRQTWYAINNTPPDEGREQQQDIVGFVMEFGNMFEALIERRLALAKVYSGKVRLGDADLNIHGETDTTIQY